MDDNDRRKDIDLDFGKRQVLEVAHNILRHHYSQPIRQATIEEDMISATDLVAGNTRIGVRVRDYHRYNMFLEQFTIRVSRPNGFKTELRKILDGCGDQLFYGFYSPVVSKVVSWTLIDLNVFRAEYQPEDVELQHNQGETSFCCFHYFDFSPQLILKKYRPSPLETALLRSAYVDVQTAISNSLYTKYLTLQH